MHALADQTHENKSQSGSKSLSLTKAGGESTFQFVDNRSGADVQRKLQETANNHPQVKRAVQLQTMADNYSSRQNKTGLPDQLKAGMESLSGVSLDDVKVHRNSSKPAKLKAHAYAQGADIHLGPGQERHLAHEAWHVVQQMQGRVKPTIQMKDKVNINDDPGLEKEADLMGAKAMQFRRDPKTVQRKAMFLANQNVVQRVLVNGIGQRLSPQEIQDLKTKYPQDEDDIDNAEDSLQTYSVYESRHSGLNINVYAPPSTGGFHYRLPEGYTTSAPSNDTNRMAAKNEGMSLNLDRTNFGSTFTQDMLNSKNGNQYEGSSKISGGMGLQEAGLDRTHHLSDSSIRIIVQWLNENRFWQTNRLNWVTNWMSALTGNVGVQELLDLMGTVQNPPSTMQLNTVVDRLSNNTHQVGFGDSFTNQKIVGSFFDSSKTQSGYDSPLAASISMATEGLKHTGLPDSIIKAALAEVIDEKSGKKKSSMTYIMPSKFDDYHPPFGGGGGFGGGFGGGGFGFGGGGMGGGSSNMVF